MHEITLVAAKVNRIEVREIPETIEKPDQA
jgi:hypothetical protein